MGITEFKVPPKTINEKYKDVFIEVRYDSDYGEWHWEFKIQPTVLNFSGNAVSPDAAMRAAKKQVDEIVGASG